MSLDQVICVREGLLTEVKDPKFYSNARIKALISPSATYVTPVTIQTLHSSLRANVIGIVSPSYKGKGVILEARYIKIGEEESKKLGFEGNAEFFEHGLYLWNRVGFFLTSNKLIVKGSVYKRENEYLSLFSPPKIRF